MKQNKKRALFYVLLFVLGVVFGLTKMNGQAEDGYLLKADEKGNDDLIYDYPLEKDQGVSEEYLVGKSTLEGFRLSVGRNQKNIRFDVKIEEKGGGITREWKDLTEQDLDDRGRICLFSRRKGKRREGKGISRADHGTHRRAEYPYVSAAGRKPWRFGCGWHGA